MSASHAIHQFLPTFERSATGNHCLQVQKTLRGAGFVSEIFAEFVRDDVSHLAKTLGAYGKSVPEHDDDVFMYQMAIGSNVADWLQNRSQQLIVNYHNISPAELWEPWEPGVAYGLSWGRQQLRELVPRTALGLAVSEYNRAELEALGYAKTAVSPLLVDFASLGGATLLAARGIRDSDAGANWLFVGSVAPHKAQHDLIKAFAAYRKIYGPVGGLRLVGPIGSVRYQHACQQLIDALGLSECVSITGSVSNEQLATFYDQADVFVSASEHEGVGIPLLEAMAHGLPLVAYAVAAVPETVGDAGLLLPTKRPATVAAAVHRVSTDATLRAELYERSTARLIQFSLPNSEKTLLASLAL